MKAERRQRAAPESRVQENTVIVLVTRDRDRVGTGRGRYAGLPMLTRRANDTGCDSAGAQNRLYAVCLFRRADLLAAVWTGKLSLVLRHRFASDRPRIVVGEPAAREHDGARGRFTGVGVER